MNTCDEWIRQRSGVVERRYIEDGQAPADLAQNLLHEALRDGLLEPGRLVAMTTFGSGFSWSCALARW